MSRLTITLNGTPRVEAKMALIRRGLLTQEASQDFYGPVFEGPVRWEVRDGFLCVTVYADEADIGNLKDPVAEYYYPQNHIARLKWELHAE